MGRSFSKSTNSSTGSGFIGIRLELGSYVFLVVFPSNVAWKGMLSSYGVEIGVLNGGCAHWK